MELQDKELESLCDDLEQKAKEKCKAEIEKANAYRDGYIQACEDFYRELRKMHPQNQM